MRLFCVALTLALAACRDAPPADSPETPDTTPVAPSSQLSPAAAEPQIREAVGPARFRPMGFTDSTELWGVMRGRATRLSLTTGQADATEHTAWSIASAPGRVSWRNELGLWGMKRGEQPERLAPTELMPGYDGPPEALWSHDGKRAVLSWVAEWDYHHELLGEDGERSALATVLDGYMLDHAALWLDGDRVLFEIVANAPVGGEPEYRESGWRGDLAVLELATGEFTRVTSVADGSYLRAAGLMTDGLLVREHGADGVRTHWLYDTRTWERREVVLPRGRTWAAGDAIVSYVEEATDRWRARLIAAGDTTDLGIAADPELAPALSPDGRLIALRVQRGTEPMVILVRR